MDGIADTHGEGDDSPPPDRRRPGFRSAARGPKLSAPEARRQGEITHLAFTLLGGREPAIAYLNGFEAALAGAPLTIATASAEGFEQVAAALRRHAADRSR